MPPEVEKTFAAALAHYQSGEPEAAAELFAAVLQQRPDDADALRLRGLALVRSGRAVTGLPLLARARRLAWRDPLSHLHCGIGLLEAGQPARAAAVLRRAVGMLPGEAAAWVNFSAALLALERPQAARRAVASAPRVAEAHHALGLAQRAAGNLAGARTALVAAVELAPQFADAWVELGAVRLQLGDAVNAAWAQEKALAARPGYGPAGANLGAVLQLLGDHEGALRQLREAVAHDAGCVAARLNLANALLLDRDAKEALTLLAGPPPSRAGGEVLAQPSGNGAAAVASRR